MENTEVINTTKPKLRIDYADIAKFFGILLVILGHTTGNLDAPFYRTVIYAFHMPLFFIISGVVFKGPAEKYNIKHWLNFLGKNVLCLAVPYFIWALIYAPFSYNNIPGILYASRETLGDVGSLTSLWFLSTLFVARILVELVVMIASCIKKINTYVFAIIASIIIFAIGFILPHPEKGYPWCLDAAVIVAAFILLGYAIKPLLNKLYEKSILIHVIVMVVSFGLLAGGILVQNGNPYLVLICFAQYGNLALFLSNSIFGSLGVIALSMIVTKLFENHKTNIVNRFMLWVGRSTIGIFLVHKNFLQEICMASLSKWGATLPNLGFAILGSIVAFIFSCVVVFVIEKFVPQLFGKFPSKTKDKKEEKKEENQALSNK